MLPIVAVIAGRLLIKAVSAGVRAAGEAGSDIADAVHSANERKQNTIRNREIQSHKSRNATPTKANPEAYTLHLLKSQEGSLKAAKARAALSETPETLAEIARWETIVAKNKAKYDGLVAANNLTRANIITNAPTDVYLSPLDEAIAAGKASAKSRIVTQEF